MYKDTSLLPVLYKCEKEVGLKSTYPDRKNNREENKDRTAQKSIRVHRFNKSTLNVFLSVSLCLLALFSLSLCIVSNTNNFFSGEKILGYIASDYLGIDPSSDNKNIYEILMSGGFGDYNQNPNKTPADTTNTPQVDNSENNTADTPDQNGNDNSGGGNTNDSTENVEIPVGQFAIIKADLSSKETTVSNQTGYKINLNEYINSEKTNEGYVFNINGDMTVDPVVLIVHTHGTEAYSEEGSVSYSDDTNIPRSEDITKNVVSVGAEMAKVLNDNGIPTIHCEIMHDKESYKNSYFRAAQTIEGYLKKYPSIQYVFDVHRDSVISDNNIKYKPLTEIGGKPTAQIMLVMGSDYNTPEHKSWKDNLTLAVKFTEQLNLKYDSFTRAISLRSTSYNQEYTKGSLLLEIGSCGNTLQEAKNAAVIVAQELSQIIKSGW